MTDKMPPRYMLDPASDYWRGWRMAWLACQGMLERSGRPGAAKILDGLNAMDVRDKLLMGYPSYRRTLIRLVKNDK